MPWNADNWVIRGRRVIRLIPLRFLGCSVMPPIISPVCVLLKRFRLRCVKGENHIGNPVIGLICGSTGGFIPGTAPPNGSPCGVAAAPTLCPIPAKSDAADAPPLSGSPSLVFMTLPRPQILPMIPGSLKLLMLQTSTYSWHRRTSTAECMRK